jgi:hypothetical protein
MAFFPFIRSLFFNRSPLLYCDIVVQKSAFSGYSGYVVQFPFIEIWQHTPEEVTRAIKEKLFIWAKENKKRCKIKSVVYKPTKISYLPILN